MFPRTIKISLYKQHQLFSFQYHRSQRRRDAKVFRCEWAEFVIIRRRRNDMFTTAQEHNGPEEEDKFREIKDSNSETELTQGAAIKLIITALCLSVCLS